VSRPAISVQDVWVRFRPYVDRKPTLRRSLSTFRRRHKEELVAVRGVSVDIAPGEAFGLVGANGAGKSTLLRCVARTLNPDEGKVVVNGRISSLLQLGVGFNMELSGRRNIYLGCLANGLRLREVEPLVEGIIEYAGIGHAVDRPVKTYSSGMFSRLAFSISMAMEPDILLLDEVLAVGDESFRDQSLERMQETLAKSGTIVYVSHNLQSVKEFCGRTMWMRDGEAVVVGPSEEVVGRYREWAKANRGERGR